MIMPCMNSTSARESGGNLAFVDGGRVLLGWPGAPGCTTTGALESRCCETEGKEQRTTKAVTGSSIPHSRNGFFAGWMTRRCSLIRFGGGIGAKLNAAY